jgi:hypothetical protein
VIDILLGSLLAIWCVVSIFWLLVLLNVARQPDGYQPTRRYPRAVPPTGGTGAVRDRAGDI